jgi:hypothetical protein
MDRLRRVAVLVSGNKKYLYHKVHEVHEEKRNRSHFSSPKFFASKELGPPGL